MLILLLEVCSCRIFWDCRLGQLGLFLLFWEAPQTFPVWSNVEATTKLAGRSVQHLLPDLVCETLVDTPAEQVCIDVAGPWYVGHPHHDLKVEASLS